MTNVGNTKNLCQFLWQGHKGRSKTNTAVAFFPITFSASASLSCTRFTFNKSEPLLNTYLPKILFYWSFNCQQICYLKGKGKERRGFSSPSAFVFWNKSWRTTTSPRKVSESLFVIPGNLFRLSPGSCLFVYRSIDWKICVKIVSVNVVEMW